MHRLTLANLRYILGLDACEVKYNKCLHMVGRSVGIDMHGVVACRDGGKKSRDCVRWDQDFAFLWRFFCFAGGEEREVSV